MGNRTFLSVAEAGAEIGKFEFVAFETNNFLAPFWFCLVGRDSCLDYRERLLTAWDKVLPLLDSEELEDLPEYEAFGDALVMRIPWHEAAGQLRVSLPGMLARYPSLAPLMSDWLKSLNEHISACQIPVVHLELNQYFNFYDDPVPYLEAIEEQLDLWSKPGPSAVVSQQTGMNSYLLGGEPIPRSEGLPEEPPAASSMPAAEPLPASRSRTKRRTELYTWLLAILSAALGLAVFVWTSSMWLAVLAFLLPSICIVLRELIARPGKIAASKGAHPSRKPSDIAVPYYDGPSPIRQEGVEAWSAEERSVTVVPWQHVRQARINQSGRIELEMEKTCRHLYPSPIEIAIDGRLKAAEAASVVHLIAKAWRSDF